MIVLDTCVIIWDALQPKMLSTSAQRAIAEANQQEGMICCEISLWEMSMLIRKRRLRIGTSIQQFLKLVLQANRTHLIGINSAIAELAVSLPPRVSQDPADRIIAATSIIKSAPLVTADKNLLAAPDVKTIW